MSNPFKETCNQLKKDCNTFLVPKNMATLKLIIILDWFTSKKKSFKKQFDIFTKEEERMIIYAE